MLLFSATIPDWVLTTADKYMSPDRVTVDLVGTDSVRTSTGVEHKALCCPYHERSSMINDIINVSLPTLLKVMFPCVGSVLRLSFRVCVYT